MRIAGALFGVAGLLWAGYVTSAVVIGEFAACSQRGWLQLSIGLLLVAAASLVPVLGGLLMFAATMAGFGAAMQTLYAAFRARRRRKRLLETAPAVPPASSGDALRV